LHAATREHAAREAQLAALQAQQAKHDTTSKLAEWVRSRGLERGERLHDYTRHLHGLFAGLPGARAYRRVLASEAIRPDAGLEVLRAAVSRVERISGPRIPELIQSAACDWETPRGQAVK
jgi:tRNA-dihydrouridine synthase A